MQTKKIFLASSAELKADRDQFEILINRKNKEWVARGVFLELVIWEDFLDAMSQTRLQDEYNKAIRDCDIFVMLFCTKVGKYTEEEFEVAFKQFMATNKPFVYTYFKDAQINTGSVDGDDLLSLLTFKKKLALLGHFHTTYKDLAELKLHFSGQLDKLAAKGFIEMEADMGAAGTTAYHATLTGSGALAQGAGATAVGAGGVFLRGQNSGNINTGTQITTGDVSGTGIAIGPGAQASVTQGIPPQQLSDLFAPLLAAIKQAGTAPAAQAAAVEKVEQLKTEVAKGKEANDPKLGKIIDGIVDLVPGAVGAVVSMFATPLLGGIAGPVTKYVLDKIKGSKGSDDGI